VLQVVPSVWTAYRTDRPRGISPGTWSLILAELLCWGSYGIHHAGPRLTILGCTGVAASLLMLARVRLARVRRDARQGRSDFVVAPPRPIGLPDQPQ